MRVPGRSFYKLNARLAGTILGAFVLASPGQADSEATASARGVLRSVSEATLASDISTTVVRIPFREGQTFAKGDELIAFECARHAAELQVAVAEFTGHWATYENSLNLQKMKAAGALEVAVAKAQADKAAAAIEVTKVRVGQCRILAPFSGRIVDVLTHEHDTPAPNSPLLRIVDHNNLEVDMIVPSKWLIWMRDGALFTFHTEETDTKVPGRVTRVGAAVDPVSQTIKVTAVLEHKAPGAASILPGMSGTASFREPRE
jgi:membrane fusion protein, multidrug efflux system